VRARGRAAVKSAARFATQAGHGRVSKTRLRQTRVTAYNNRGGESALTARGYDGASKYPSLVPIQRKQGRLRHQGPAATGTVALPFGEGVGVGFGKGAIAYSCG
jgi:hypothetical protein